MRRTSKEAWDEYKESEDRDRCFKLVMDTLLKHGPLTGREICARAGHEGLWKRLSELSKEGFVEEAGKRMCTVTGKRAIMWGFCKTKKSTNHSESSMIPFPDRKYRTIYADPPWLERGAGRIKRGADRHYPLMKTADIIKLPIASVADDNCHLYLWVTNNFLEDGFKVMSAWGFKYKTVITWVKDRIGLGQYFRGVTEQCLFGVRGHLPYKCLDEKRLQGETAIHAPRRVHSEKPEEMREMIMKVSHSPYIELFARRQVPNWDVWGNEINPEPKSQAKPRDRYEIAVEQNLQLQSLYEEK